MWHRVQSAKPTCIEKKRKEKVKVKEKCQHQIITNKHVDGSTQFFVAF